MITSETVAYVSDTGNTFPINLPWVENVSAFLTHSIHTFKDTTKNWNYKWFREPANESSTLWQILRKRDLTIL